MLELSTLLYSTFFFMIDELGCDDVPSVETELRLHYAILILLTKLHYSMCPVQMCAPGSSRYVRKYPPGQKPDAPYDEETSALPPIQDTVLSLGNHVLHTNYL